MLDFITANIEKYDNEEKMLQFLNELGLPGSLDSMLSGSKYYIYYHFSIDDISDNMWNRIHNIQVKGGTNNIMGLISNVEKGGEEINKRISDLALMLNVT